MLTGFLDIDVFSAESAQQWAQLARKWYSFELGSDSEQAREMERIVAEPRSHLVWGNKKHQNVGGPGIV